MAFKLKAVPVTSLTFKSNGFTIKVISFAVSPLVDFKVNYIVP